MLPGSINQYWEYDGYRRNYEIRTLLGEKQVLKTTLYPEYAYTTGTPGTAQKTITYKYGDSQWRDLLTEYNGKTVTSDAIGNIKNDGIWNYTWEHGRQLASQTKSGTRIAYSYDANGSKKSHYHPDVNDRYRKTPHVASMHDHYYYPD